MGDVIGFVCFKADDGWEDFGLSRLETGTVRAAWLIMPGLVLVLVLGKNRL